MAPSPSRSTSRRGAHIASRYISPTASLASAATSAGWMATPVGMDSVLEMDVASYTSFDSPDASQRSSSSGSTGSSNYTDDASPAGADATQVERRT